MTTVLDDRRTVTTLAARLLLAVVGLAALVVLGAGLLRTVSFARTAAAVDEARAGTLLVLVGYAALLAVALAVRRTAPAWVGIAVALPAVLCGGLTLLADETLLPQLVALPAMGVALAGLVGLLVARR